MPADPVGGSFRWGGSHRRSTRGDSEAALAPAPDDAWHRRENHEVPASSFETLARARAQEERTKPLVTQ